MSTTTKHLTLIEGGAEDNSEVGSEKWSKKVRKDARGLAGKLDEGYIELARLLYLIYDTPIDGDKNNPGIFTGWGYSSFSEYCEEELNIHRKKAQRLTRIWYNLEVRLKGRIDPALKKRIISLGFSKVRELVTVLTARNVETWVDRAERLSYPKLAKAIQKYREAQKLRIAEREAKDAFNASSPSATRSSGPSSSRDDEEEDEEEDDEVPVPDYDESAKLSHMTFAVYPEQRVVVQQALDRAEQLSNSSVKSNNLHLICLDFISTNDFKKGTRQQRLRKAAAFNKALGFDAVLFEGDEVVYGLDTLEKAAKG
jgi:hypothetical protein